MRAELSIDLPPDELHSESKFASRRSLPTKRNDGDLPAPPHPSTCPDMSAVKLKIEVPSSSPPERKFGQKMGLPVKRTDSDVPAPPVPSQNASIFREDEERSKGASALTRSVPSVQNMRATEACPLSKSLTAENMKNLSIHVPDDAPAASSKFGARRGLPVSRNDGDVPPPPDHSRAPQDWRDD
ncbi:hypothetical protein CYMTET_48220 [Cymbomonas tetramitiformis]|uniref:Uncharacterized protein n=1 Tax=Cymbomonas tetramitiformis TaxID=36881 RepID=A0AAE0BSP7_9CHLO|nr:hypothetical protein CYMTET_48220 [Cymbomonas tetramitiformis]